MHPWTSTKSLDLAVLRLYRPEKKICYWKKYFISVFIRKEKLDNVVVKLFNLLEQEQCKSTPIHLNVRGINLCVGCPYVNDRIISWNSIAFLITNRVI